MQTRHQGLVGREQQRRPVTVTGHIVLPGERSAALYETREKFLVKKIHGSLRQMFDNTRLVLDGRREAEYLNCFVRPAWKVEPPH